MIITSNQRLALQLQLQHDQAQIKKNKITWESPLILPLNTWMTQAWRELDDTQVLLSEAQTHYLLEKIIRETCDESDLLNPYETASNAASAWKTLQFWNVDLTRLAQYENQEVMMFCQWIEQLQQLCQLNHWVTAAEIPGLLLRNPKFLSQLKEHESIRLVGFDELVPVIQQLFASTNCIISDFWDDIRHTAKSITHVRLHDQHSEIQHMASWAKKMHEENPLQKIACIIPKLDTLRRSLFNIFTDVFTPEVLFPGAYNNVKYFNISAAPSLHEYPIISVALQVLNWLTKKIDIQTFAETMQSPYLHESPEEQDFAAKIDIRLREINESELPFNILFTLLQSTPVPENVNLNRRFYAFQIQLQNLPTAAYLSTWLTLFTDALEIMGWPGYRTLTSEEYQICMRWRALLQECALYKMVCREEISLTEALYLLKTLVHSTPFQSEGSLAPVQILGVLEAAGTHFDKVWVMGLNDETWPPAAKPNPFIPYELQKTLEMPHATAERELKYTLKTMARLIDSTDTLIFSSPSVEEDKILSPSPLLKEIRIVPIEEIITLNPTSVQAKLTEFIDSTGPLLQDSEAIRGGSWILTHQSQCPFKAFAKVRLKASAPEPLLLGILPRERGNITHEILEKLWDTLKTQEKLLSLSDSELNTLITSVIDTVINTQKSYTRFKKRLFLIEKNRLRKIVLQWMKYEKNRGFFTVFATEITQKISIQKLSFSVRIDRIDTLENGKKIIIDYKTGISSIMNWFGLRPNELQLPLYLCANNTLSGIIFAEINASSVRFKGLVSDEETHKSLPDTSTVDKLTKNKNTWLEQIEQWKMTIDVIAREFINGHATVAPTDPTTSCAFCDLKPLCRIEIT